MKVIPVDVIESDTAYTLKADLPGVKKEDVSLEVDGNIIRIGVKQEQHEEREETSDDKRWHRSERRDTMQYSTRALRMPENTDFTKMSADYTNGVLTIDCGKQAEKVPESRTIQIK